MTQKKITDYTRKRKQSESSEDSCLEEVKNTYHSLAELQILLNHIESLTESLEKLLMEPGSLDEEEMGAVGYLLAQKRWYNEASTVKDLYDTREKMLEALRRFGK